MDLNNQQKGQNNQEQGRSIPPRGSVLRSHNLTNIFPSQPASSVRQHAPPTAEQLLDARRRLGLSSLGTARSGVPSSLNHTGTYQYQSRAATKSFMPSLPTGFPPRPPRVSPFENGYVSNPNQTPSAAEPKVNQPTAVTTCPKYSPPRAVSIPKPGSEFVSPSDPVAQARLIKKMNGGYNSAGIRAVPPYNPTIPRYPTSSDPLVLKNSNLKISKLWAAKYPSLKEKPPVPDFQRLGFVPAPTTSGAPKPSRPVLPTQRQSQVNPVSEPKETDVHRPQDIASVPQTPMHSEPSRQELQHIQGSVVGNSNAESPTSPPSGLASRFRLSIRPVASSIFQNRRSHTSKTLFSEPSMADSDGDIIMTDCKPQISSLKRKISCVEDPMESEIDAGRELRRPIVSIIQHSRELSLHTFHSDRAEDDRCRLPRSACGVRLWAPRGREVSADGNRRQHRRCNILRPPVNVEVKD